MTTAAKTMNAQSLTQNTYFVFYGEHDKGCKPGFVTRDGIESAERSAKLFSECGYEFTDVRHALSIAEMGNEG